MQNKQTSSSNGQSVRLAAHVVVLTAAVAGLVPSALAQPSNMVVLDQVYALRSQDDREFFVEATYEQAQTFRVGTAGILSRVDLYLKRLSATNQGDLLFDVRGTSGGVPLEANAPVLASATLPAAAISGGGFVTVDVRSFGISVATGQVLAAVLRVPAGAFNASFRWLGSGSNAYARGTLYTRGGSTPTWTAFGGGSLDASFRTYVDLGPAPEADLAVAKTDSPDPAIVSNALAYTITVTNRGPTNAVNVRLTDRLTTAVNFVSAAASQGSCALYPGLLARRVDFATGPDPYNVAIGDLDRDGKPDLAVVSDATGGGAGLLSILRNTSVSGNLTTDSFAGRADFVVGADPTSVAIGDLDGDGLADVAVANFNSFSVSVFRNESLSGAISFGPRVDFAAGLSPVSVAIADLDGDGKREIVAANANADTVSVFRNTSTVGSISAGSFAPRVDFAVGDFPYTVVAGDLDGDGKRDLAVVNTFSGTVSVLRNTSTAGSINASSFAPRVDFPVGVTAVSVATGDLDGDGRLDLAVANAGSATVSVLRNQSTPGTINSGSFAGRVDFSTGPGVFNVAIADLDGDGKLDLATANGSSLSVLLNTSAAGSINAASFAPRLDFPTGSSHFGLAIGDLDGDGRRDLASGNATLDVLSVFRNVGAPGSEVIYALGNLTTGATAQVSLVVTPTQAGMLTNLVAVGSDMADPNPGNNTATAETLVFPANCLTLTCPTNRTVWTCSTSAPVSFNVTVTDPCSTNVTVTCTPPSGSAFPIGTTAVTCVATDNLGYSNGCSFTVTVLRDTSPPSLLCPTGIVVSTTGSGTAVVFSVTATDDRDTNVTVSCTPPSGSVFPRGTTLVNCAATDDCGNTAQCSFAVRVAASGGDAMIVTATNTTGQAAAGLRVRFTGAGGDVFVDALSLAAPGCPPPNVPSNGTATDTAVINWGGACVAPMGTVTFRANSTNGPLGIAEVYWTDASGQNLGSTPALARRVTVLTFDPNEELKSVPADYGDRIVSSPDGNGNVYGAGSGATPNVVVEYGPEGSSVLEGPEDYGDLRGVAYQEDGDFGVLEVTLTADPGFSVVLDSFDLAGLGWDYVIDAVQVIEATGVELFNAMEVLVAGDGFTHTTFDFAPAGLSAQSLTLRIDVRNLGNTESHRVGLDNVQFHQVVSGPCPPSPRLTLERTATAVVLSWTGDGYCLQSTPRLADPSAATVWTTVPGTSPVTVPIEPGVRFFRLICPCP